MNQLFSQLFLSIFSSIIGIYLIISILKRKFPMPGPVGGHDQYFKGWKAVVYASFFLIMISPLFFRIEKVGYFLFSLIIGIPVAFVLHNSMLRSFAKSPSSFIADNIPPRKIEISNLILWGVVGIFVGIIVGGLVSSALGASLNLTPNLISVIFIFTFLIVVYLTAWWGARTTWLR